MVMFVLGILALILLLGNAYLYFFPMNSKSPSYSFGADFGDWEKSIESVREENERVGKRVSLHEKAIAKRLKTLDTTVVNLNSKTENAIGRIRKIENSLLAGKMPNEKGTLVSAKIERLEDFRRNATIELEAIKEILPELKKKKNLQDFGPDLEEKIHNLVFHANNGEKS